jgi:hypothetical protein
MQILIQPAGWRYESRSVGCEQLDDGIGCAELAAVQEDYE